MPYTLSPEQALLDSEPTSLTGGYVPFEFSSSVRPAVTRKRYRAEGCEPDLLDAVLPLSCILTHVSLFISPRDTTDVDTTKGGLGASVTWWLAQDRAGLYPLTPRVTSTINPNIAGSPTRGGVSNKLDDIQWEAEPENRSIWLHAYQTAWEETPLCYAKLTWRPMSSGVLAPCGCE